MENSLEHRPSNKDKYSHRSNTDQKNQEDDINVLGSFSNSWHEVATPVTIQEEEFVRARQIMKVANSGLLQVLSNHEI